MPSIPLLTVEEARVRKSAFQIDIDLQSHHGISLHGSLGIACSVSPPLLDLDRSLTRCRNSVVGLDLQDNAATCGPAVITTSHITTITIEQLITYSHSCYTKTIATPHSGDGKSLLTQLSCHIDAKLGCPDLSECPPQIMCIQLETTTAFVPPADPCCPQTPTQTIHGPCEACRTGCATSTSTVFVTTPPNVRRDTACATTVWRSSAWATGPTTTYHPLTQTRTSLVKCNGCSLVISDLNGVGPVVSPTFTVTNTDPAVVTSYACQ